MSVTKVCIVLPTYNEAGNIARHLARIFEENEPYTDKYDLHVLVVDDNSPDGTADIVRDFQDERVHLLVREEKEGLGRAYIHGMQHAMEILGPDVIMEMDADGQHEPRDIFRILESLDGVDMVIGSRYCEGGHVSKDWSIKRRLTSACARMVTRTMLRLGDVQDCSGGFRAIKTDILKEIDLDSLDVKGYAFQAVILEAILYHGGTVREVPITFNGREVGESKMGLGDMIEGGTVCIRIGTKRLLNPRRKRRRMRARPIR